MLSGEAIPPALEPLARRAVHLCPTLALRIEAAGAQAASTDRQSSETAAVSVRTGPRHHRPTRDATGGTEGNERLTAMTGAVLLILFAAEGITILAVHHLMTMHFFVGFLLVGPVVLKLGSTGYRFVRYYRGSAPYVRKGPPVLLLRLLGPVVIATSAGVIGSGIGLAYFGPVQILLLAHKGFFILWFGAMTIHVLWYAPRLPKLLSNRRIASRGDNGWHGKALAAPDGRHGGRTRAGFRHLSPTPAPGRPCPAEQAGEEHAVLHDCRVRVRRGLHQGSVRGRCRRQRRSESDATGQLSRILGIDDNAARIVEVWQTPADAQRFAEQSAPQLQASAMPAPSRVSAFDVTSYETS